ncbi:MAG TPA: hypothetical protein VMW52_09935 [Phycisphaerae bacterium]|nr:hypothetical protein [Phycisphaerae bacterium]
MSLSSASTLTDALGQYNDNLSWENDPTKAAAALEAIRWLLANRPASTASAGVSINYSNLADEKKLLEAYLAGAGSTRRTSFVRGVPLYE